MKTDLKDAKILIVDDQQANIDVLEGLLLMQGYTEVRSITDPRLTAGLIESFKPDLLLLDLMMPHLDGFAVMELLKTILPPDSFMPILVLTADATQSTKQKALSVGASDFLTKPFDLVEVGLRIKNLLYNVFLVSQLKDQNIILEEKVKVRTAEIVEINKELIKAKNKAEEMSQLKSFFLSNLSHEFRTPLVSILGFCEIMLSELTDPDQLRNMGFISKSANRLQRTLNDILALVDLERQRMEASFEKINIVNIMKNWENDYSRRAAAGKLSFNVNSAMDEMVLYTDPALVKTVIDNIIDNSLKFTKTGGVSMNVYQIYQNDAPYAVLDITDTGIGISPEMQNLLFIPFRQQSEGLARTHEGMGLGLTVAKQLTEVLHGEICVASVQGEGTTVTVKLPVIQSDAELQALINKAKQKVAEAGKPAVSDKPAILIVEDNEPNRMIFKKLLSKDYKVEEAPDGVTALAMAEVNIYDLILMDINLGPGIDGVETFKRIRQLQNYKDIPVIAITAFAFPEDRQRFLDIGFTDYHPKPIERSQFFDMIKSRIQHSS